jgi:hypothetical protein
LIREVATENHKWFERREPKGACKPLVSQLTTVCRHSPLHVLRTNSLREKFLQLHKTPTVRNRSKHKETNRPNQLPASLLMVPLIPLPIKQCAWCNDSISYGKFKSTTGKIGSMLFPKDEFTVHSRLF